MKGLIALKLGAQAGRGFLCKRFDCYRRAPSGA